MVFHPTLDYEIASGFSDLEYGDGGPILRVGPTFFKQKPFQKVAISDKEQILEGRAVIYGVKHWYKSRWEMFESGCFKGSLYDVEFHIDHVHTQTKLGQQEDGSLELFDSDAGLDFRLKLAPGAFEKLDGRDEMSPCYVEHIVETRMDNDVAVRVIKSASLFEISACFSGSIEDTFAVVKDADSVGPLVDDVKYNFACEAAAMRFKRALKSLKQN